MDPTQQQAGSLSSHEHTGIIFIGPIIGVPPSLVATFDVLKNNGVKIETIDIFDVQNIKKGLWKILGLTLLPGSHKRRIKFANSYDEQKLFETIYNKINSLSEKGVRKIVLGGMSGGFVFAARMIQTLPDDDVNPYISKTRSLIKGLFGISPIIFYPPEVSKRGADLNLIPTHIPTTLIWGDDDNIVPKGTILYGQKISQQRKHIKCRVLKGSEVGIKDGKLKHQFFGGKDFIKPLTNVYWNSKAERIALEEITKIVKTVL